MNGDGTISLKEFIELNERLVFSFVQDIVNVQIMHSIFYQSMNHNLAWLTDN